MSNMKICPSSNTVVSCGNDCIYCHKFKEKKNSKEKQEISSDELIYFIEGILKIKLSLWQVKLIKEFCKLNNLEE